MLKHSTATLLALAIFTTSALAVGSKNVEYIGGTIPGLAEKTEGKLTTTSDQEAVFTPNKKDRPTITIPYASITELEYGQKAGRRVGVAIMVSPLALFSKKRKHYLTIAYTDAKGKEQAGVFEVGKDIIRTTLTVLEVRSGKDIGYQDEEARRAGAQ